MSLVSLAIRLCLQRALRQSTFAEDRVYDSQITPVDAVPLPGQLPLIVISTDEDKGDVQDFDLLRPNRELEVVLEMVLATFVTVKVENGPDLVEITIPHTEPGMEASLAFMARQVYRAMMDPLDPWAELLKEFMSKVTKTMARRGADATDGTRYAARQLVFVCDPLYEPDFGERITPDDPWGRLIALMEADPELADLAEVLRAEIETGTDLASWRRVEASRGWTDAAVRIYGDAPVDPTETGEAPWLTEATIEETEQEGTDGLALPIVYGVPTAYEVMPED